MTDTTNNLRNKIDETERSLIEAKNRLAAIERVCHHNWSEPKREFVEKTEYVNGTNIIRQGIDWWYETVSRTITVPIWTRTCAICGKVEKTEKTKDEIVKKPAF